MIASPDDREDSTTSSGSDSIASDLAPAHMWAAMSHEIRTPLTGILGTLEVLASTSLTDEQRRMIATAEKSSEALMRVVNDVLDLARLEATTVDLELRRADIADLIEDCAELLANQAEAKGLVLTCETDIQIPDVVCDPIRLRQVLTNLATNAIKFTDTGRVALSVSLVEVAGSRANVRFVVEDTGIGIPAELKSFLFQPFSQIKDSGNRGAAGVGLGLAICRILVEAMGGKIQIESRAEQGARFVVDVPFDISPGERSGGKHRALFDEELTVVAVNAGEPAVQIAMNYLRDASAMVTSVDSMSALGSPDRGLLSTRPQVVIVGPDVEQVEVEAISESLQKMRFHIQPRILWLHPRAVGGALSLMRKGIQILRAYPLRRASLIAVLSGVRQFMPEAREALTFKRRFQMGASSLDTSDAERARGKIILIIEDNLVNQQVLSQQLAILGMPCDVAGNGNVALQLMEERDYTLLLCDCHMPGMDGLEFTRIIREREKDTEAHVPIIAVTANALPGESDRCKAAGMDDYLAKPIEIKSLRSAMERWIDLPQTGNTSSNDGLGEDVTGVGQATSLDRVSPRREDSESAESPVDLKNLQTLYGNDDARLSAVLSQWTRVIDEASEELRRALKNTRRDQAIEAVHRLKGSAGIAGAHSLSAAAAVLEGALRLDDNQRVDIEGARVLKIVKSSLDDVAAWKAARLGEVGSQAAS